MKIFFIGNLCAGKTSLGNTLKKKLGWKFIQIDDLRKKFSNGTVSGEYFAYSKLISFIEASENCILEFSGCGIHKHTIRATLQSLKIPFIVIYIYTEPEVCLLRFKKREKEPNKSLNAIPYPFNFPPESLINSNHKELEEDYWKKAWDLGNCEKFIFKYNNSDEKSDIEIEQIFINSQSTNFAKMQSFISEVR